MKVTLENVRVSYVHVFEPSAMDGNKPKYSLSILIDPNDTTNMQKIEAAIQSATQQGLADPKKWGGRMPTLFKNPLRNGNTKDLQKNPEYANMWFIGANSIDKPLVVGRNPSQRLTSPSEFYSGCYANVIVQFYPFHKAGSDGVAVGLKGCQFVGHGEQLSGGMATENDFACMDTNDFAEMQNQQAQAWQAPNQPAPQYNNGYAQWQQQAPQQTGPTGQYKY